ncbi:MAG TPA: PEGA domain-containing protein [Polyangiales bacterium]|nr:PEGA domain-containing protein [Polyangiales bacterium]
MARLRPFRRSHVFLFALWSSSQLYLQPAAAEPSPPERETARALMAEGDRLRASGDLRAAMNRYQAAHAIVHAPTTGLDLARVQASLGLLVEARSTASEVIHHPSAPNEPRVFTDARAEATALANELETRVPSVKAEVQPADAAYTVSVDGTALPPQVGSLPYKVNPGQHNVRVEAPGYATVNRQVTLNDAEVQSVIIQLVPQPQAAAQRSNMLPSQLVAAGDDPSRDRALRDRADAGKLRGVIGLGVGGAAFVAGTVTGIMAMSLGSDIRGECSKNACNPSERDSLSTANTLANVSNITLPIGVIGIAYGLYELLTLPSTQRSSEHASATHFEFTGTGAVLRGSL